MSQASASYSSADFYMIDASSMQSSIKSASKIEAPERRSDLIRPDGGHFRLSELSAEKARKKERQLWNHNVPEAHQND